MDMLWLCWGKIVGGREMVFILEQDEALCNDSLEIFRITLRKSFRWKLMERNFWFTASENRCTVMYTIDLFLEQLFLNHISI